MLHWASSMVRRPLREKMGELGRIGLFEWYDTASLRIDPLCNCFDRAVFATRIHRLQYYEERLFVLCVEDFLELDDSFAIFLEAFCGELFEPFSVGICLDLLEVDFFTMLDSEIIDLYMWAWHNESVKW